MKPSKNLQRKSGKNRAQILTNQPKNATTRTKKKKKKEILFYLRLSKQTGIDSQSVHVVPLKPTHNNEQKLTSKREMTLRIRPIGWWVCRLTN